MTKHQTWLRVSGIVLLTLLLALSMAYVAFAKNSSTQTAGSNSLFKTLDDQFYDIAKVVPEFAGLYADGDDGYVVVATNPSRSNLESDVRAAIANEFGEKFVSNKSIRFVSGEYSFSVLKNWYDDLSPKAFKIDGVIRSGIDEKLNKIKIGVADDVENPSLVVEEAKLLAQVVGIPQDTLIVSLVKRPVVGTSLRDEVSPLAGGLQVEVDDGSGGECTLGIIAERDDVVGFITNSHCTAASFGLDPSADDDFYQPTPTVEFIGTEEIDPDPFTTSCQHQPEYKCRYSDSAFIDIVWWWEGLSDRGSIYKTEEINDDNYTIDGEFRIVDTHTPIMSETLHKVGRTTGWSNGTVIDTCESILSNAGDGDVVILCTYFVDTDHYDFGDSGSPVFKVVNSPQTDDVAIAGIVWGGVTDSVWAMSSSASVFHDLGSSADWEVCASGFSC
jgi:hypothetical protein